MGIARHKGSLEGFVDVEVQSDLWEVKNKRAVDVAQQWC